MKLELGGWISQEQALLLAYWSALLPSENVPFGAVKVVVSEQYPFWVDV